MEAVPHTEAMTASAGEVTTGFGDGARASSQSIAQAVAVLPDTAGDSVPLYATLVSAVEIPHATPRESDEPDIPVIAVDAHINSSDEEQAMHISPFGVARPTQRPQYISCIVYKPTPSATVGISMISVDGCLVVSHIDAAGLFALCPILPLDRVVSINGVSFADATAASAIQFIKKSPYEIILVVHVPDGDPHLVATSVSKPTRNFVVGVGLKSVGHRLKISSIALDGPISRSLLNINDQCLYINGHDCSYINAVEATSLIKETPDTVVFVTRTERLTGVVVAFSDDVEMENGTTEGSIRSRSVGKVAVGFILALILFVCIFFVARKRSSSNERYFYDCQYQYCTVCTKCTQNGKNCDSCHAEYMFAPNCICPDPYSFGPAQSPATSPGYPSCQVCGADKFITIPNGFVPYPFLVDCHTIQMAGFNGFFKEPQCPLLEPFLVNCGCSEGSVAPVAFLSPVSAPAHGSSPGYPACQVCGDGKFVTIPNGDVPVPGSPPTNCGTVELAGQIGFIEEQYCPLLGPFLANCGCSEGPVAPVSFFSPVSAPVLIPAEFSPGYPSCQVCGAGKHVTWLYGVVPIPGAYSTDCLSIQSAGLNGFIEEQYCGLIEPFLENCGCAEGNLESSSYPVAAPVAAPAAGSGPSSTYYASCEVCGVGKVVTIPRGIVDPLASNPTDCKSVELAGLNGNIEEQHCPLIEPFLVNCGCAEGTVAPAYIISPSYQVSTPVVRPVVSPGHPSCQVCGAGKVITNPGGVVAILGTHPTDCRSIQRAGLYGWIDEQQCPIIGQFLDKCSCAEGTVAPVSAPALGGPVFSPLYPSCQVCGAGKVISIPDGIVVQLGSSWTDCQFIQSAGFDGLIEEQYCELIEPFLSNCGCTSGITVGTPQFLGTSSPV